jgi:hypothetical protein
MSMGRGPKLSPPGSATRANPQRPNNGPSTLIGADSLDELCGAIGVMSPGCHRDRPVALERRRHADRRQQILMIATSSMAGTLVR